jgi:hypothetical protein
MLRAGWGPLPHRPKKVNVKRRARWSPSSGRERRDGEAHGVVYERGVNAVERTVAIEVGVLDLHAADRHTRLHLLDPGLYMLGDRNLVVCSLQTIGPSPRAPLTSKGPPGTANTRSMSPGHAKSAYVGQKFSYGRGYVGPSFPPNRTSSSFWAAALCGPLCAVDKPRTDPRAGSVCRPPYLCPSVGFTVRNDSAVRCANIRPSNSPSLTQA